MAVTAPHWVGLGPIEGFLRARAAWISDKVEQFRRRGFRPVPRSSRGEYKRHKAAALVLAQARAEHFAGMYGLNYRKISIRNQKTRWGSCSRQGNLSFNYRIFTIAPELADYIIVHELCHLSEFNHSEKFWNLVRQTVPDCQNIRRKIRNL